MHDINFIRKNSVQFDNSMKNRGEGSCSKKIIEIDSDKRNIQTILQKIKTIVSKTFLKKVYNSPYYQF